jgi:hypothetical protein
MFEMVGGLLLAGTGIVMALDVWRARSTDGFGWPGLSVWGLGEACLLISMAPQWRDHPWLLMNFGVNLLAILFIMLYKWRTV